MLFDLLKIPLYQLFQILNVSGLRKRCYCTIIPRGLRYRVFPCLSPHSTTNGDSFSSVPLNIVFFYSTSLPFSKDNVVSPEDVRFSESDPKFCRPVSTRSTIQNEHFTLFSIDILELALPSVPGLFSVPGSPCRDLEDLGRQVESHSFGRFGSLFLNVFN
jgi:hypothetical protein